MPPPQDEQHPGIWLAIDGMAGRFKSQAEIYVARLP